MASPNFIRDQVLQARVEEFLGQGFLIVNVQGQLMRVKNDSGRRLAVGQELRLLVVSLQPLELKILQHNNFNFDIVV